MCQIIPQRQQNCMLCPNFQRLLLFLAVPSLTQINITTPLNTTTSPPAPVHFAHPSLPGGHLDIPSTTVHTAPTYGSMNPPAKKIRQKLCTARGISLAVTYYFCKMPIYGNSLSILYGPTPLKTQIDQSELCGQDRI